MGDKRNRNLAGFVKVTSERPHYFDGDDMVPDPTFPKIAETATINGMLASLFHVVKQQALRDLAGFLGQLGDRPVKQAPHTLVQSETRKLIELDLDD
jgi:hypothetical protein